MSINPVSMPQAVREALQRASATTGADFTMLAEGTLRLVCARKSSACQLFDLSTDPAQTRDVARERAVDFARLRGMVPGFARP